MNWTDPVSGETFHGFKEMGFLPGAFLNILVMLGWSPGLEKELFSLEELVEQFSIDRVHKGGAKFDFEKAKWFNSKYIQGMNDEALLPLVKPFVENHISAVEDEILLQVIHLMKDRCTLLTDFWNLGSFLFISPEAWDLEPIREKWNMARKEFFDGLVAVFAAAEWTHDALEASFNAALQPSGLKKGDVLLPLRIMLVGGKFGPGVFQVAELIGREATIGRIKHVLTLMA
jgi:glutamyl-tRNA synthetase